MYSETCQLFKKGSQFHAKNKAACEAGSVSLAIAFFDAFDKPVDVWCFEVGALGASEWCWHTTIETTSKRRWLAMSQSLPLECSLDIQDKHDVCLPVIKTLDHVCRDAIWMTAKSLRREQYKVIRVMETKRQRIRFRTYNLFVKDALLELTTHASMTGWSVTMTAERVPRPSAANGTALGPLAAMLSLGRPTRPTVKVKRQKGEPANAKVKVKGQVKVKEEHSATSLHDQAGGHLYDEDELADAQSDMGGHDGHKSDNESDGSSKACLLAFGA